MSLNNSLNAVIALIENRPEIAKEIFRNPNSDIKDISGATGRLYMAFDRYLANKLRTVLVNSLSIQPSSDDIRFNEDEKAAFYEGVRAVESMIEAYLIKLES